MAADDSAVAVINGRRQTIYLCIYMNKSMYASIYFSIFIHIGVWGVAHGSAEASRMSHSDVIVHDLRMLAAAGL